MGGDLLDDGLDDWWVVDGCCWCYRWLDGGVLDDWRVVGGW